MAGAAVLLDGAFLCLDPLWSVRRFGQIYQKLLRACALESLQARPVEQPVRYVPTRWWDARTGCLATSLLGAARYSGRAERHGGEFEQVRQLLAYDRPDDGHLKRLVLVHG